MAMPAPLKWVSTPSLGQGRASGGSAAAELFEGGSAQRRRPLLETLVRESVIRKPVSFSTSF